MSFLADLGQRKFLPANGYRPDAIFSGLEDYWGISFIDLKANQFDIPIPATIEFTFQDNHYQEIAQGQSFKIMEGPHQVGEGKVLSISK